MAIYPEGVEVNAVAGSVTRFYADETLPPMDLSDAVLGQGDPRRVSIYEYDGDMPMYAAFRGLDGVLLFDADVRGGELTRDVAPQRRRLAFVLVRYSAAALRAAGVSPRTLCPLDGDPADRRAAARRIARVRPEAGCIGQVNSVDVDCGVPFEVKTPERPAERAVPTVEFFAPARIEDIPAIASVEGLWESSLGMNLDEVQLPPSDVSRRIAGDYVGDAGIIADGSMAADDNASMAGAGDDLMTPVDILAGEMALGTDLRTRAERARDTKGKGPAPGWTSWRDGRVVGAPIPRNVVPATPAPSFSDDAAGIDLVRAARGDPARMRAEARMLDAYASAALAAPGELDAAGELDGPYDDLDGPYDHMDDASPGTPPFGRRLVSSPGLSEPDFEDCLDGAWDPTVIAYSCDDYSDPEPDSRDFVDFDLSDMF